MSARDVATCGGLAGGAVVPIDVLERPSANDNDGWPELVPLSRREVLPPFPLDALPRWLREWVEAEAIFTQTPPEMAAAFALASVSALATGRVWIEARDGWIEGTNLWLAVVAEPGTRKSPVHSDATAPVRVIQAHRAELARGDVARRTAEIELRTDEVKRQRAAISKLRSTFEREAATRDYLDSVAALEALAPIAEPRIIVGDVTPERLIEMLGEQGGRLAMMSDEDSVIGHLLGRYSGSPAIECFLSAYSNRAIDRDRRSSKSVRVERPALAIATCLQPGLLERAGGDDLLRGRGLLDRFAFVCPPNRVGRRDMNPPTMPAHVREAYASALVSIGAELADVDVTIGLDVDAVTVRDAWLQDLERKRGPSGTYADVVGFASKLDGLVARIAGVLHVAACRGAVAGTSIRRDTIEAATRICDCLAEHASAAFDLIGADEAMRDARSLLAWARDRGEAFTDRDVTRARGAKWAGNRLAAALDVLEKHGYLRPEKVSPGRKGGRPKTLYHLRPEVLSGNADRERGIGGERRVERSSLSLSPERGADPPPPHSAKPDETPPAMSAADLAEERKRAEIREKLSGLFRHTGAPR